jgi:hypothetical protein
MSLSPSVCAFCNEKRSCVAITLQGKPAHKTITENKKTGEVIEKWDRDCRFLCFYCIRSEVAGVTTKVLKVQSENFFILHPPRGCSTLIWKGDEFFTKPTYWDQDRKGWKITLPIGEYVALFLAGSEPKHRPKKDLSTPLFGDLSKGMDKYVKDTK